MRRSARPVGRLHHLSAVRLGSLRMKLIPQSQLGLGLEPPPRSLPVLEEKSRGTRFRALEVRRVLNSPATTNMGFWSLNPYVGCEFGCSYCYARKTHEWTVERAGGLTDPPTGRPADSASDRFEHEILVKHGAPDVLLRTLEPGKLAGAELVIGTATDPYQPAERRFLLTRKLLEALLLHRGLAIGLITKSPLIARDLDVLTQLARQHELTVNLSIASLDAALLRRFEARSPAPHARIRALARLTRGGIHAGLMIAPILPGITDSWTGLAALMEAGRDAGARFAIGYPLRLGPAARSGYLPVLEREFPELLSRYRERYGTRDHAGRDYEAALARRLRTLQQAFGFPVGSKRG